VPVSVQPQFASLVLLVETSSANNLDLSQKWDMALIRVV
ncbi:hypothetical protein Tco_0927044, partial [Tanacetum coccineum]